MAGKQEEACAFALMQVGASELPKLTVRSKENPEMRLSSSKEKTKARRDISACKGNCMFAPSLEVCLLLC